MMLVAAKWRLFCETNPHLSSGTPAMGSEDNTNTSTTSDYVPKPGRPGRTPKEAKVMLTELLKVKKITFID